MESEPIVAELVGGPLCGEIVEVRDMGPLRLVVPEPIVTYSTVDPFASPPIITYAPVVAYGEYVRTLSGRFLFRYEK